MSLTETILCLSGKPFYTSFLLTWAASSSNMVLYEVAYAVHPNGSLECSAFDTTTFTELYTSYLNTTDSSVNVTGLQSSTCYIFGIRPYTVGVGVAGEWTILTSKTLSLGIIESDFYSFMIIQFLFYRSVFIKFYQC